MLSFIDDNSIPTILGFEKKALEIIIYNDKTTILNFLSKNDDENKANFKLFEEVSKALKGKIVMCET